MPICKLDDIEIAYIDRGVGPHLVLLHGFPLDNGIWKEAADLLEATFRVIAPDLRGFGKSACDEPFTINSLAQDVHAFLIALQIGPCILGGLSMGGYVALAFAKQYRADLRALMLIDTKAAADTPDAKRGRDQMIETVRSGGSAAIADQMFPKMIAATAAKMAAATKLRSMMESCPPLTVEHALAAMRDREDYLSLLPTLTLPTLIVVGAEDAIATPDIAIAMQAATPKSKLAIIPAAGHMAPLENPKAFADAVIGEFGAH